MSLDIMPRITGSTRALTTVLDETTFQQVLLMVVIRTVFTNNFCTVTKFVVVSLFIISCTVFFYVY